MAQANGALASLVPSEGAWQEMQVHEWTSEAEEAERRLREVMKRDGNTETRKRPPEGFGGSR